MDFIKKTVKYIHKFSQSYAGVIQASILGVLGLTVLWLVLRLLRKSLEGRVQPHILVIVTKVIKYIGLVILVSAVLTQLGFDITALLGAAGIVGIAIGFAAQTSVSNMISGMFLILEYPFKVGDFIEVGSSGGFVESIDLLAVRLRTSDGRLMRVPNETLIKSSVTNKTFYKNRRITITALVDRNQDVEKAVKVTQATLEQSPSVKKDKAPSVSIDSSTMWTVDLCIWAWVNSRRVVGSTADITQELYDAYQKADLKVSIRS